MNTRIILLSTALVCSVATAQTSSGQTTQSQASSAQAAPTSQSAAQWAAQATQLAQQARATYPAGKYSIDQTLWKGAADAAEAAVQADPQNAEYLKLRAQIYTDVGFWKMAESAWAAYFVRVPPGSAGVDTAAALTQYNLGYAAYTRGAAQQAATAFANCTRLNPQNADCLGWSGRVAFEAGQYPQAQAYYAQALAAKPGDKTLAYFSDLSKKASTYGPQATRAFSLGYAALEAGKQAEALTRFQEAAQAAPAFIEAQREAGRVALLLGNPQAALSAYQAASSLPGATAADRYNLGLAQEGQQYGLAAVQAFRAAYSQYTAGNKAAALDGFTKAATLSPTYAKAWAWVGRVQYEAKNFAAAADAYGKAVQLDPNDKTSAYYLRLAQQGK